MIDQMSPGVLIQIEASTGWRSESTSSSSGSGGRRWGAIDAAAAIGMCPAAAHTGEWRGPASRKFLGFLRYAPSTARPDDRREASCFSFFVLFTSQGFCGGFVTSSLTVARWQQSRQLTRHQGTEISSRLSCEDPYLPTKSVQEEQVASVWK